ncbi:MAG: SRPBCC family protein [Planctomycetota bacterium]|jgi:carbon monoxide dehydrogenase subunit G
MAGFKRSVVIDRPIREVFDFATNLDNAHLLMPNVTKVELLTPGELKPGSKFRETRIMKGKESAAVIEVVEHEPPELHAARSAMMGMEAVYRFRFAEAGSGTRVDMEALVRGNLLWKLFLGMISRMMEKEDGDYLQRLKSAVETPQEE